MAPTRTPGRKRRDADYSAIGQYGRKTGITVPDLGPRDEYGLEPVENLFSSPHKVNSPRDQNGTMASGDDMDLESSVQPDPSSVIASVRHAAQLLPKSRSPVKTKLGSSPRRSAGNYNSPLKPPGATLTKQTEEPFFSRRKTQSTSRRINGTTNTSATPATHRPSKDIPDENLAPKSPRNMFDLMEEESEEETMDAISYSGNIAELQESGDDLSPFRTGSPDDFADQELIGESPEIQDGGMPSIKHSNPGLAQKNKRKNVYTAPNIHENSSFHQEDKKKTDGLKSRPAKKHKTRSALDELSPNSKEAPLASNENKGGPIQVKRRRGPGQRNPKARVKSAMRKDESGIANLAPSSNAQLPSRSPKQQLDSQISVEISEPIVLRSGRTSVKPLAFWRGEQIVYEPPRRVGKELLPGGYLGVDPGRKSTEKLLKKQRRKAGSRRPKSQEPVSNDEDSDQEDWETTGDPTGVLSANVFAWDPETQRSIEDGHEEIEIALAPAALDERTQWDKGRTFKFGKTLTLPFFHSGVVDLPPGGEKRPKNSRKNHMIFWVFSGRVQVDVSGNTFSVGRGGMWQVPRGNSYGLSNPFDYDVRIFFAQGSYMEQPEDESALMANAALMAQ